MTDKQREKQERTREREHTTEKRDGLLYESVLSHTDPVPSAVPSSKDPLTEPITGPRSLTMDHNAIQPLSTDCPLCCPSGTILKVIGERE